MFIHVPKCAGTTLIKSFARLGPQRHLIVSRASGLHNKAIIDFQNLIKERQVDCKELVAVSGHDVFIGLDAITGRTPLYATILRDPVARYISHYRFFVDCAYNGDHVIHDYTKNVMIQKGRLISLATFVEQEIACNTMSTYLAAANQTNRERKRESISDPDEIIELAKKCLQKIDFVGLVESFPADLNRLCEIADIPPASAANKSHHSLTSADVNDDLIQKIRDSNKLDIEVYRLAENIREEKAKALGFSG